MHHERSKRDLKKGCVCGVCVEWNMKGKICKSEIIIIINEKPRKKLNAIPIAGKYGTQGT